MKNTHSYISVIKASAGLLVMFLVALSVFPFFSYAQITVGTTSAATSPAATVDPHTGSTDNYTGLVKCSGVAVNKGEVECNFTYFIATVSNLINWAFGLSIPIAVTLFSYAGFLHVLGTPKNIEKARGIFKNVAIGFIIMLIAFTVVHTLVGWFVNPNIGAESLLQVK